VKIQPWSGQEDAPNIQEVALDFILALEDIHMSGEQILDI
jgi:hypothetical protein